MNHSYCISKPPLELLPLTLENSQAARLLRNAAKDSFVHAVEVTAEEQEAWFRAYLSKPGEIMFAIFYDGHFAGQLGLYNINRQEGCCEFGRLVVDPFFSGKRIGMHATQAACTIALETLELRSVFLQALENNFAARLSYERVGFTQTGIETLEDGRRVLCMELKKGNMTIFNDENQVLKDESHG